MRYNCVVRCLDGHRPSGWKGFVSFLAMLVRIFSEFPAISTFSFTRGRSWKLYLLAYHFRTKGGGPRVVVSTAAFHARVRGSVPGLGGLKEIKLFLPHPRVKVSIVGSLRDREVACSASDRQGSNFKSCVWRTVSSQSSHHPQEVLLAQFSLYVHKGGLKPDSSHFISDLFSKKVHIIFMYKFVNKTLPELFSSMFKTNSQIHTYPTQTSSNLHTPIRNFKMVCLIFAGVKIWNNIKSKINISSNFLHYKFQITTLPFGS